VTAADRLRALHQQTGGSLDPIPLLWREHELLPWLADTIEAAQRELPTCGEWLDHPARGPHRCGEPADLILWGRLFDKDALGPRCMNHAAMKRDRGSSRARQVSRIPRRAAVDGRG
jgi:hypothetical protein